jgi:hypothetical protein
VFDANDFDETLPGPWEWDLKRLVASCAVAGRERGLNDGERREVALAATRSYRTAMQQFAGMRAIDVWYLRLDIDELVRRWQSDVSRQRRKTVERAAAKARAKDSLKAFSKLTEVVDGKPRFRSDPPLLVPIRELQEAGDDRDIMAAVRGMLHAYRRSLEPYRRRLLDRYRLVDVAHKVVGVGSVGNRAWAVLLLAPAASTTRSSCRSRRPGRRSWSPTSAGRARVCTDAASSRASTSCRRRATSCSATSRSPTGSTGGPATSTSASSGTARARAGERRRRRPHHGRAGAPLSAGRRTGAQREPTRRSPS